LAQELGRGLQLQTHFSVLSYETKNKQWATDKEIDGVLDGAIPMSGRNPVGTVSLHIHQYLYTWNLPSPNSCICHS
jgi:hypothetical protein